WSPATGRPPTGTCRPTPPCPSPTRMCRAVATPTATTTTATTTVTTTATTTCTRPPRRTSTHDGRPDVGGPRGPRPRGRPAGLGRGPGAGAPRESGALRDLPGAPGPGPGHHLEI